MPRNLGPHIGELGVRFRLATMQSLNQILAMCNLQTEKPKLPDLAMFAHPKWTHLVAVLLRSLNDNFPLCRLQELLISKAQVASEGHCLLATRDPAVCWLVLNCKQHIWHPQWHHWLNTVPCLVNDFRQYHQHRGCWHSTVNLWAASWYNGLSGQNLCVRVFRIIFHSNWCCLHHLIMWINYGFTP